MHGSNPVDEAEVQQPVGGAPDLDLTSRMRTISALLSPHAHYPCPCPRQYLPCTLGFVLISSWVKM